MALTKYEQETQIYFNEEEPGAEVYTASARVRDKFLKLCQERPEDYKLTKTERMNGEPIAWTFKLSSKTLVKFHKPKQLTDEAREILRQRALSKFRKVNTEPKSTKNAKEE